MLLRQNSFAGKLREIDVEFRTLRRKLKTCCKMDFAEVKKEIKNLEKEALREKQKLLEKSENSHSEQMRQLSERQAVFLQSANRELWIAQKKDESIEMKIERTALYAEYAVDFTIQSAKHALLAVLSTMQLESEMERGKEKIG